MNRFLAEGEDLLTLRSLGRRLRDLICVRETARKDGHRYQIPRSVRNHFNFQLNELDGERDLFDLHTEAGSEADKGG